MNFSLLYMHYSQLADATGPTEQKLTYSEEIEVVNRTDALFITHHFRNLNSNRYEIIWPEGSEDISCFNDSDSTCERINNNVSAILEGDNNYQSISYTIPKSETMTVKKVWKSPFVTLKGAIPNSTMLHITDETGSDGIWISGLKLVGSKKTEMIDYSLFKGEGQVTDLYWQQKTLPLSYKGNNLSILGESVNEELAAQLNEQLSKMNANHVVLAVDPEGELLQTDRFVIANLNLPEITDAVLDKGVRSRYFFPEDEQLTSDLMVSILIDKPIGTERSREAFGMLKESLRTSQLEALKAHLADLRETNMDASKLDQLIGEVSGLRTTFVQKNREGSYPLLFEEPKIIHINGKAQENLRTIVVNNRTLYPAIEILTQNGYTLTITDQSIYIENDAEKFRFSLLDPFYVLNERRYTFRDSPFELIDNEYYFEEDTLRRLFHLSIQKDQESIFITTLKGEGI